MASQDTEYGHGYVENNPLWSDRKGKHEYKYKHIHLHRNTQTYGNVEVKSTITKYPLLKHMHLSVASSPE